MVFPNKDSSDLSNFLLGYSNEIQKGFKSIDLKILKRIASELESAFKNQNTIFTCGNGGSTAISEHFVCDYIKMTSTGTNIQPIFQSLSSNVPILTAIANDIGYEDTFSFQLERFGRDKDVLLCVSSSGNSPNIIKAIEMAKQKNIKSISYVGFDGGEAKKISDYCIHIPSNNYGVIEDLHHSLMHMLAQFIRLKNLEDIDNIENTIF